ncbi:MAG: hypothetical protein OdinLCB4_001865 [Candidatus Odinarchaeum yellowstonii]|uniref:Uncharacterized protein n=1 Tax=Odinarchaeota yellowstonii (strain LCB_4) TaxID=1841599 RepID=A0AAF0D307_ODILC|nr:MAG: hypothetical protein OdinLCB4_001865 [Candidatus Odinarchaeum yellowstonii]
MKKKCSVVNCRREVSEGEYKIIDDNVFCIECATLFNKRILKELFKRG